MYIEIYIVIYSDVYIVIYIDIGMTLHYIHVYIYLNHENRKSLCL